MSVGNESKRGDPVADCATAIRHLAGLPCCEFEFGLGIHVGVARHRWKCTIKLCAILIALAMIAGIPASANANEFNYSYLEMTADLSRTQNTAAAPLEDDMDGKLLGIAGFWEVLGACYICHSKLEADIAMPGNNIQLRCGCSGM